MSAPRFWNGKHPIKLFPMGLGVTSTGPFTEICGLAQVGANLDRFGAL